MYALENVKEVETGVKGRKIDRHTDKEVVHKQTEDIEGGQKWRGR